MFNKLEAKRIELHKVAIKYGLQNEITIRVSKELDQLILSAQKEKQTC